MTETRYEKLAGRSLTSVQSCYLGEDHLLILDGQFKERIKRLKYSDIEAILICPTAAGKVLGLVFGLGGLLFLVVGLSNLGSGWAWFYLVSSVILFALLVRSVVTKGSAMLGVQTAVQTIVLEGVTTLRKALRVEAKLAKRVEQVQGELSEDALRRALESASAEATFKTSAGRESAAVRPPPMRREIEALEQESHEDPSTAKT